MIGGKEVFAHNLIPICSAGIQGIKFFRFEYFFAAEVRPLPRNSVKESPRPKLSSFTPLRDGLSGLHIKSVEKFN